MKQKFLTKLLLMLLCTLGGASFNPAWGDTYEQLTSIASIDESAEYVLGIDGTGFHYSGTSSWGKTALPSAQTPYKYTLKKAQDGKSFTAETTISGTKYYLQIPTSNTFSMATSTGTNTDIIIGTTQVSGTNYAVANKSTTTRHLRINGTSGLRSYAGTTGTMAFFYKVVPAIPASTAPTIDGGGESTTFTFSKDVGITAADGATIYYTTDGTTPTTSSSTYTAVIPITNTTTIKAVALEDGKTLSSVSSKTFTKVLADNTITVTGGTTPSVDRTGVSAVDEWTPTASATSGGTISYAIKSTANLTKDTDFTFNTTTGKVSFLTAYKGTIVITASVAADDNYTSANQDITLTVNGDKRTPVIAYDDEDTEISSSGSLVIDPELIETDGTITVTSSNTSVATVSEYTISAVADGTTTITINTAEGDYYNEGSGSFELEVVTPSACDIALTGAPVSKTFDIYNNATPQVIAYTTSSSGAVSIASNAYASFEIDQVNKKITVTPKSKTPSAQTITINQAAAGRYLAGSTTFSLTVNNSATSETYEKVTNDITLAEGDELAIVNETNSNAAGGKSDKYLTAVSVSISDNAFETTSGVVTYVLGGSSGAWTLKQKESSNFLSCNSSADITNVTSNPCTWAISISEGNARVKASVQSSSKDQYLQYNHNGGTNPRFKTYTSSQSPVQLYRRAKYTNTITVTNGLAQTLELEDKQDLTLSATSYCGAVSFAYKSATNLTKDTNFMFNPSTGELHVNEGAVSGTITITASTVESATHKAASSDIVITVVGKPVDPDFSGITDQEIMASSTYTLVNGEQFTTDGTVTLTTDNSSIASVSGLVVTAEAVGTTTIRVSAAKGSLYNAGSTTFNITVTAPAGKTEVSDVVLFNEAFSKTSGPYEEGSFSGSSAYSITAGEDGWTFTNGNGGNECAKFGSSGSTGSAATRTLTVTNGKSYKLSFKCAPWSTGTDGVKVTVTGGTIDGKSSATTGALTSGKWNTKEYTIIATSTTMSLTFEKGGTENRFFLDDIVLSYTPTATVTLNKYGYATYCSVNPIDFSSTESYTAWRVNSIASDGTITFKKITEKIKGGQGVLLFNKDAGEENTSAVTINFANGSTVFDNRSDGDDENDNLLVGTTASTYVATETVYGLSNAKFVKNNAAGTIPAGKAYINASSIPAEVKAFTFVFEDEADGIAETRQATREEVEAIFNLAGQRISKMQKGINIINGRKVLK